MPSSKKTFVLDTFNLQNHHSGHAIGAVLSQYQSNAWKPVAFLLKMLSETERNYKIYDHELLAIMTALAKCWHHLMGACQDFEIWTDHQNLEYFCKPQKLNHRQACWVTELANYHFTLHHKPRRAGLKADLLSRRADHATREDDNMNVTVLKPKHFCQVELITEDNNFLTRAHQCRGNRDQVVEKMLASGEASWTDTSDLILWKGRVYIPIDHKLQEDIIHEHHDSRLTGHPGQYKTHELVT